METGGCPANEGQVCTLTDGTSVFMYRSPRDILLVPCPIVCRERTKTQQMSPDPLVKGVRPPSRITDAPQRGSWWVLFVGCAVQRRVSTAWCPRGRRAWVRSQPCTHKVASSPAHPPAPQGKGDFTARGGSHLAAGQSRLFPEQDRLSSGSCDSLC